MILTYSLDKIFKVSSLSSVFFLIGIISGYFETLTYEELHSNLELIRGFAKAVISKD
jgi:hypothetical protein